MPKVFVHGNPETAAIWSDLIDALAQRGVDDVITLSPPGFGAPCPDGWGGTPAEYRAWLLAELHSIDGDIDLVGHDWGAGHVLGLLAEHPTVARSWATDCAGMVHPDYQWHDAAIGWQTPGVGEDSANAIVSLDPDTFALVMGSLGMKEHIARQVSAALDQDTARCILNLYRNAVQPTMRDLGARLAAAQPARGMVIVAENDHYAGTPDMHVDVARSVGATVCELPGVGHWWMVEAPAAAAEALIAHWRG